jgi:hypothetical protein
MVPPVSRQVLVFVAMSLGIGCSGSAVRIQGNEVTAGDLRYAFGPVPPSWRPMSVESNDAAWFDATTGGIVHVDHTCERAMDTPLPSLVQHLLIGFTQRETVLEETVPFDRREARHVVVNARLDGVPRSLELYVMKKDGCVYDLGFVAPPDRFEAGRPAFDAFVRGFRTVQSPLPQQ